MIALGVIIGAVVAAPIAFAMGWFARLDSRSYHTPADIRPALRREVRR